MNMISTGSFLTETGASNKQSELVKKLTAAWEKKNSKTARAGGASLMALSLAACGGEDNTPFSQADVDAAKAEGVASVDITSDNTDVMLAQADYDAAIETAKTSNDADIAAAAKIEALTAGDGTVYANVDAAYAAGSNLSNADAVAAALTDASGVVHNNVDAAIASNDASVEASATAAAEATLVAGSGFDTVAALLAAYEAAVAPAGSTSAELTTSRDVPTMTGGDDAITSAYLTLGATDVIADSSTTDSDTLTAVFDLNSATTFTAINVETITLDIRAASNNTLDLTNVTGAGAVNLVTNYGTNLTALTVDNIASGTTIDIAAGLGLGSNETVTLAANEDTHTSAVTLNMNGDDFTLATQNASTDDIDQLTINSGGSAANKVTLSAANAFAYAATNANSITLTGDQNITIAVADQGTLDSDNIYIIDNTTAGTTTLEVTGDGTAGANELSYADVDVISLKGTLGTSDSFTVASGARVDIDSNFYGTTNADLEITTAASNSTLTLNLDVSSSDSNGAATLAGITLSEFNTVNFGNTSSAATVLDGHLAMSVAGIGEEIDLNIATGAGLTISGNTSASTGTLDAVSISGTGDFVNTGTMSATTVTSTSTGDTTFTGNLTADTTIDVAANKTFTAGGNVAGSLTVTGAGDVAITGTTGETSGVISLTNAGDSTLTGNVTGAVTAVVAADKTLSLGGTQAGDMNLSGAGDVSVTGTVTGDITSTAAGELDFAAITGDSNFTLTANTGTVDELDVTGNITGSIELSGSGDADLDGDISGGLTVGGSVTVAHATGKIVSGALTATGSGDISTEIDGAVVAGSASGNITTTGSGTQTGTIVTGSGDDSITIANGDNPITISTGGGNDTIDAQLGAAAVRIDGGDGNDSITGTTAADELTGGFGTDTFVLTHETDLATSASVADTVKDYSFGASGDIINLDEFADAAIVDTANSQSVTTASSTSKADITTEDLVLVTDAVASTWSDLATVVNAAINSATGEDAFVAVSNGTDARIYAMVDDGASATTIGAAELTLVTTLSGVTTADFANAIDANFSLVV